jgi:hypothetical protein
MTLHRQFPHAAPPARRGFVLLAVLVFVLLLGMVTLSLLYRSQAEETGAASGLGSEQAWSAAVSGVREALRVAAAAPPGSDEWQDNPTLFRGRQVYEDGADTWYFTVFSPSGSEDLVEIRYGLTDEAAGVNLNQPNGADFEKVPRVTAALAANLRQYIGLSTASRSPAPVAAPPPDPFLEDPALPAVAGDLSTDGALGSDSFSQAPIPRHGPLAQIEELVSVPGFSRALVFGEDANRNGRLDANEDDGPETAPVDNQDGHLDHGLLQYFTVAAYDPDRTLASRRRTNLNDPEEPLPTLDLPPAFTNYVAALRTAKLRLNHVAEALESTIQVKDAQGAEVSVPSGIGKEELPRLLDLFTTDGLGRQEGRINVNTASALVLATLPGVDLALAESIVSTRTGLPADRRGTIAWLYQEGLVDAALFRSLAPHLTARSAQFRFQVLGYGLPSGRYRVLSATIDVGGAEPRIIALHDLTRLGLPFKPTDGNVKNPETEAALSRPVDRILFHTPHG